MPDLRFLPKAKTDLEKIGDYVAADNPVAAAKLVFGLREQCRLISESPLIGRDRAFEFGKGIRTFPHGRYVIFYRVISGGVEVIRVVHSARDLSRII